MSVFLPQGAGPIGVFDSGYGGLTILKKLSRKLPQYDYLYLGDNARAPYGSRSFETVYHYTRQAVLHLFQSGCQLVILACNTASAKALRTIQRNDLPLWDSERRVLGVIRPTAEAVGNVTKSRHIGILATKGTILSGSYGMEIAKFFPDIKVNGLACPLWAPLVENFEIDNPGTEYFVRQGLQQIMEIDCRIDTLILGCTHYPLLHKLIAANTPKGVTIMTQGEYVANSLADYFQRHPQMEGRCTRGGTCRYQTTEDPQSFEASAAFFMEDNVRAEKVDLYD